MTSRLEVSLRKALPGFTLDVAWSAGRYEDGATLFDKLIAEDYVEFLTLPAYRQID